MQFELASFGEVQNTAMDIERFNAQAQQFADFEAKGKHEYESETVRFGQGSEDLLRFVGAEGGGYWEGSVGDFQLEGLI